MVMAPQDAGPRRWEVVCGKVDGLPVYEGSSTSSPALAEKLPNHVVILEVDREGDRLHFLNLSILGPKSGWVDVKQRGREVLVPVKAPSLQGRSPALERPNAYWGTGLGTEDALALGDGSDESRKPLEGWTKLVDAYSPPLVAASETSGRRTRVYRRELPPIEELMECTAEALVDLMGFPVEEARNFIRLEDPRKRRILSECKALSEMTPEKRKAAFIQLKKAWPKGPFPTFGPDDPKTKYLAPGSCFPIIRWKTKETKTAPKKQVRKDGWSPFAVSSEDKEASRGYGQSSSGYFNRRRYAPAQAQKAFFSSLPADPATACREPPLAPDATVRAAAVPDLSRLEGTVDKAQLVASVVGKAVLRPDDIARYLNAEMKSRVVLFDGSLSSVLQSKKLSEADYRGERFKNFKDSDESGAPILLQGNDELLVFSKPDLIVEAHKEFLSAGADIIKTNTYRASPIAQRSFKLHRLAYDINKAAAQLAKKAVSEVAQKDTSKPRFVAGVISPLGFSKRDLTSRDFSWEELVDSITDQVRGLSDGGVDILFIDAVSDTIFAKAAVYAIEELHDKLKRRRPPVLLGFSLTDDGQTAFGQNIEALLISIKHTKPLAIGISTTQGSEKAKAWQQEIAAKSKCWTFFSSGAGSNPEAFAFNVSSFGKEGLVNILGGGAGILPKQIAALATSLNNLKPSRALPELGVAKLELAGRTAVVIDPSAGLNVIGQGCTVQGSSKFRRLVEGYRASKVESRLQEAVEVAVDQCELGADVLEVNLDIDALDGRPNPAREAMGRFIRFCEQEPKASKPYALCSYEWRVIKEGLTSTQGRSIVNGICLMLGEEEFLKTAKQCMRLGAAIVVLAIGEKGVLESKEDKIRVLQKSYKLLRTQLDFPAEDIILDCQLCPLGAPEQAANARNCVDAIAELRRTCPGASFVAGLGNVSLAFKDVPGLRDMLHSAFTKQAVPKGLNLVICQPGKLPIPTEVDAEGLGLCEEMILNSSVDGEHPSRFMGYLGFRSGNAICMPIKPTTPSLGGGEIEAWWQRPECVKEAKEAQKQFLAKRRKSTPAEQKAHFQKITCEVRCSAMPVSADPGFERLAGWQIASSAPAIPGRQISPTISAKGNPTPKEVFGYVGSELSKRVLLLDGDMGAALQAKNLNDADFCGTRFGRDKAAKLKGNLAILPLTKPDVVEQLHLDFLKAGADICRTNTLMGDALIQRSYGTEAEVYELNKAAAQLAKKAAAAVSSQEPDQPRFVAGVLGACTLGGSQVPSWDDIVQALSEQLRGLVEGGADLLVIDQAADTLIVKAAIYAVDEFFEQTKKDRLPLIINAQVDSTTGRLPCGQTVGAFLTTVKHGRPLAIGLHLDTSKEQTKTAARCLAELNPGYTQISVAGGTASREFPVSGQANLIAGGQGSTVKDIQALATTLRAGVSARSLPRSPPGTGTLQLAGLEMCSVGPQDGLRLIGQRCSMTGSAKFKSLIQASQHCREGVAWKAAVDFCAQQVEALADVVDFNLDSLDLDSRLLMGNLLRHVSADERVARSAFMVSSGKWEVIEEGLKNVRGKCIVNAITLLQSEAEFLRLAKASRRFGAAVVVMAIDRSNEVLKAQDRVRLCQHCYRILRSRLDFPPEDIIFDCSLGPLGGGNSSPQVFLEAIAEVRRTCPGVSLVAGVSNLSVPWRNAKTLRDALHSQFLSLAVSKGLNLALVEAGALPRPSDLEEPTRGMCEEAVLDRSKDGGHYQRMTNFVKFLSGSAVGESGSKAIVKKGAIHANMPDPPRPTPSFKQPIQTLIQATGTINASIFQAFGSKCHAANNFHRLQAALTIKRTIHFSSISVWMGQGGSGPITGASSYMDGLSLWERHQGFCNMSVTVLWGAIGEIGLRRAIYGSRDVFAQFDLGQKLIGPADTQFLERMVCCGNDVWEFIGLAYLDNTWQATLTGMNAHGGGLDRKTFADM